MLIQLAIIWTFVATILKIAGIAFMTTISWYLILLPLPIIFITWAIIFVSIALLVGSRVTLTKKK